MDALKHQIGGDHYRARAIQPIEYCLANNLPFCEGNVIKYVTRWRERGGLEDLLKAKHYIEFLIENEKVIEQERAHTLDGPPPRGPRIVP